MTEEVKKQLQTEIDDLVLARGKLSRQVGQTKKQGGDPSEIISGVKELSIQIDQLKSKLEQSADNSIQSEAVKPQEQEAPALFLTSSVEEAFEEEFVIEEANDSLATEWNSFVKSHPQSSVYHHWEFKEIIEKSFGHRCYYFAAKSSRDGRVLGVLPSTELNSALFGHFLISLPFFTYGGGLAVHQDIEKALVLKLIDVVQGLGAEHIEIRKTSASLPESELKCKSHKVSMVRALPNNKDEFWKEVGSKVRAQVKKSTRFELRYEYGREKLLDDFYEVFAENMRDLGTPVYSKQFFQNLISSPLKEQFEIGVLYSGQKAVSACFLMHHNGMQEIPWASTLKSANHMNANMAMYAAVLDRAIECGFKFFDFGRSSPDAGTYRFKKQWGAKPQALSWYYWLRDGDDLPELNPNNPKFKLLIAIWQRMPVWLSKLIGPAVVKYLP